MDVEIEFEHNLKPKGKKRRKRKSNLSLNQSKKKRKKYSYGKIVRIKKCDVVEDNNESNIEDLSNVNDAVESNKFQVTHCEIERKQNTENQSGNVIGESSNEAHFNQAEDKECENTYFQNCLDKCTNELIKPVLENLTRRDY